jgi:hypothetical protein
MSDIPSGIAVRYDSRLRRAVLLLGHVGCGLLFAGGCMLAILPVSANHLSKASGVPQYRLLPEAGFLMGLAAGLATIPYLYRRIRLSTLVSVSLAAGLSIGLLLTGMRHRFDMSWPFIIGRTTMGFAASICWMSNIELAKLTLPNHCRWRVTGQMQFAFMGFGLFLAIMSREGSFSSRQVPAPSPQQSPVFAEDRSSIVRPSALIVAENVQYLLWVAMLAAPLSAIVFHRIRQGFPTEVSALSPAAAASQPACSARHDHDHETQLLNRTMRADTCGTPEICDAADCCGGARPAPNVPQWAGVVLAGSAFLLLFGPLYDVFTAAIFDATVVTVWIPGAALLAGVGLFRLGAKQTGNTITLPLFLILSVTLFPVQHWVSRVPLNTVILFLSLAASAGTIEGLLAIVRESFRDNAAGSTTAPAASVESIYAAGAVTAAILLAVVGLIRIDGGLSAGQMWILPVVVPLITGIASVCALRSIPQPVVVTRFAARFLKTVV